jgi:hypothetical protein
MNRISWKTRGKALRRTLRDIADPSDEAHSPRYKAWLALVADEAFKNENRCQVQDVITSDIKAARPGKGGN